MTTFLIIYGAVNWILLAILLWVTLTREIDEESCGEIVVLLVVCILFLPAIYLGNLLKK